MLTPYQNFLAFWREAYMCITTELLPTGYDPGASCLHEPLIPAKFVGINSYT